MKRDKTVESAIFDSNLVSMGEWQPEEIEKLAVWTKIYKYDDKRLEASNLVAYLIPHLLNDDCTTECKKYARRLAEKLILLEDLLYTTRGRIAKKFYRDHLNHMLRTTLISRAIAKRVECLGFNADDSNLLSIAALVHDIAYPLAEASKMLTDTTSAMEECYRSLKFFGNPPRLDTLGVLELFENFTPNLAGLDMQQLAALLENHNHGLMSALEFLFYVTDRKKYSKVIEAIALHDSEFQTKVLLKDTKILGTLILSDEIQDWGRPASLEDEPAIAEIKNFRLEKNLISGQFDVSAENKVSPLRQLHAKIRNLSRIDLTGSGLNIELTFVLPTYDRLAFWKFEQLLQETYNNHPQMLRILEGLGEEMFSENYFGARLLSKDKEEIVNCLTKKELAKDSPFLRSPLYTNEIRFELLCTSNDLGEIKEATILNQKDSIILKMEGKEDRDRGILFSQKETPGKELCKRIAGEIFIFHSIIADLRKKPAPTGLYLTVDSIKETLTQAKIPYENKLIEDISLVHRCLQNNGFFFLESMALD